jgi:hypothetical protein
MVVGAFYRIQRGLYGREIGRSLFRSVNDACSNNVS